MPQQPKDDGAGGWAFYSLITPTLIRPGGKKPEPTVMRYGTRALALAAQAQWKTLHPGIDCVSCVSRWRPPQPKTPRKSKRKKSPLPLKA